MYSSQQINTAYPLPLDTEGLIRAIELKKELQKVITEPIFDGIDKAPTEPNLSITSNDIKIKLNKVFWWNYKRTYIIERIMKTWWNTLLKNGGLVREMEKSQLGRNLLRNSSVDSIQNHTMEKMKCWTKERTGELIHFNFLSNINTSFKNHKKVDGKTQKVIFHSWMNGNWNKRYVDNNISSYNERKESKYENPSNIATDSFFKAYDVRDIKKENGRKQIKRKDNDEDNIQPNIRRCKAEKFEAI
ncbi:hypothetical protein Tco_0104871 [Tanacetum coccineum]